LQDKPFSTPTASASCPGATQWATAGVVRRANASITGI
jgi:hypothetical protein